ncbi:MAG: NAD-dependent deacylase [Desulfobacca sp.]|nr:NAD-dependent deacylase [Desulfobacca sp.]
MKRTDAKELAALIQSAQAVVALTGAGISVDSGIPSFRGAQGLWTRYDPLEYAHIRAFRQDPAKVWKMLLELDEIISRAQPNPAHLALAALEQQGKLKGVITQNVDNLHQAAGSRTVVEFHGNAHWFVCLRCGRRYVREELDFSHLPLYCQCQGLIKPDVVFFGEEIPARANAAAWELIERTDLLLVIGTSAAVAPASLLPYAAKRHGALIVEINLESTPLTANLTDYFIPQSASLVLPQALALLSP